MLANRVLHSIRSYGNLMHRYGIVTGSKLYLATRTRWKYPIYVEVLRERVLVRAGSPDLGVAQSTLADEFDPLAGVLPGSFDGLIIDAGGYIGTAAIKLARLYPKATIVTIEPSQENFELLVRNTRSFPNIRPVRAALVPAGKTSARLGNRGTGPWGYTIIENPQDRPAEFLETVETVTLENIVARHGGGPIGIAKIDIEGAEKDLFVSHDPALAQATAIFVELHDRIVPGCRSAFEAFSKDRVVSRHSGEKFLAVRTAAAR